MIVADPWWVLSSPEKFPALVEMTSPSPPTDHSRAAVCTDRLYTGGCFTQPLTGFSPNVLIA